MRRAVLLSFLMACGQGVSTPARETEPERARPQSFLDAQVRAVEAEEACAMQSTRAERGIDKQVDIIFVIDNSSSMSDEIDAVRRNINDNFARVIADSGVDYRVVLLSRFGSEGTQVCIDPPLASEDCGAGIWGAQSEVLSHYDVEIQSNDAFCRILETFDRPDPAQLMPEGWGARLRSDAQKVFVVITDDSASCTYGQGEAAVIFGNGTFGGALEADPFEDALRFHQALLRRSPEQFGVPPDVRYRFYSIVGMQENDPASEPYFPHQQVNDASCDTAASPGRSYQALSIITDALRYPVCEGRGFDAVFRVLARSVVESAKAECIFEIPEAPPRQGIDLTTINVEYIPGDGSGSRRFSRVRGQDDCRGDRFLIEGDRIALCPQACAVVEADRDALVNVLYGCVLTPD